MAWSVLEDRGLQVEALAGLLPPAELGRPLDERLGVLIGELQLRQMLLGPGERVPAPWGPIARLGAAALANLAWLVEHPTDAGAPRIRAALARWPDEARALPLGWGDVIALHLLAEHVAAWRVALEALAKVKATVLAAAKAAEVDLATEVRRAWPGRRKRLLRETLQEAAGARAVAEREAGLAAARHREVSQQADRWDALNAARSRWLAGPWAAQAASLLAGESPADGALRWLLRAQVARLPADPLVAAAEGPIWGPEMGLSEIPESVAHGAWRLRLAVLQFYRTWAAAIDPAWVPRPAFGAIQVVRNEAFFAPWRSLRRAEFVLRGRRPGPGTQAARFLREMGLAGSRLDEVWDMLVQSRLGPQSPAELQAWRGDDPRLPWFARALADLETPAAPAVQEELCSFYARWAEGVPPVEELRRLVPDTRASQAAFVAFFAPWMRLRERGLACVELEVEARIEALRGHLCRVLSAEVHP